MIFLSVKNNLVFVVIVVVTKQIKADVETKGEFINSLITKVHTMMFTGIEDLLDFVEWLDKELSTLVS